MKPALSSLIALVPAAYLWWTGRRLLHRIDDPAFPELRFAAGKRTTTVFVVAVALAAVLAPKIAYPLIIVAALAVLAANFTIRRRVFDETWGLLRYLDHAVRFWTAMIGAWFLLASAPAIAQNVGSSGLPVAVALIALAFVWGRFNAVVFPVIVRARPLEDPGLAARFEEVLARARCRRPRIFVAGAPGGRWVNGIAVPSLRRSSVVLTRDLLDDLTPDESTAIFAHEVAHLEYFEGGALLRREILATVLSAVLVALMVWLEPGSDAFGTLAWIWPLGVLLALIRALAASQAHEHASDVRAVELVGDAEVLASALTKIHLAMRMPRRWDASREDRFSHPSLARRLRAIRESVGAAEPASDDRREGAPALLVRDADHAEDAVLLDAARLFWLRGLPGDGDLDPSTAWQAAAESRVIRYSELSDLRLDVSGERCYLTAIDGRGERLKLRLAGEDVARVKRILEVAERHVGGTSPEAAAGRARRARRARRVRVWGLLAAISALLSPQSLPLAALAALALWRPGATTLLAAGVGAAAVSVLHFATGQASWVAVALGAGVAALLLVEARGWRRHEEVDTEAARRRVLIALAVLGGFYALAGLARLAGPLPAIQLHLWARYQVGLTVVFAASAATLWFLGRRWSRAMAPAALAAALALQVAASGWFARTYGGDPMSEPLPISRALTLKPDLIREVEVAERVIELRLSATGRRVAARVASYTGAVSLMGPPFQVERGPGDLLSVAAIDLEFIGDDEIAYLTYREDEQLMLQTRRLATDSASSWSVALPALADPGLRIDEESGEWQVSGRTLQEGAAIRLTGRLGGVEFERSEWRVESEPETFVSSLHVAQGARALAVANRYTSRAGGWATAVLFNFALRAPMASEVLALDSSGTRSLARTAASLTCAEPYASQRFVCHSTYPSPRTRLWSIDVDAETVETVAVLPSDYYQVMATESGRALAWTWDRPPLLIEIGDRRVWQIDTGLATTQVAGHQLGTVERIIYGLLGVGAADAPVIDAAALGENALAVASQSGQGARIAVFELDD